MPCVCGVLPSSELPGMTRTPSCFHFGAWSWPSWVMALPRMSWLVGRPGRRELLAAPCRAGEALGLLGGAEQRFGLVDAFLLLGLRIRIRDDPCAGLHVHG